MSVIKVRRGTKAQLTTLGNLSLAELGYATDTKELFIGNSSGGNTLIGVNGAWGGSTTSSRSAVHAFAASDQSLTANVNTLVVFGTEEYDNLTEFSSSRFTASATGIYQINSIATFLNVPAGATCQLYVYYNGVLSRRLGYKVNESAATAATSSLIGSAAMKINSGDYVEIYAKCTSAVSLSSSNSIDTSFDITRIA